MSLPSLFRLRAFQRTSPSQLRSFTTSSPLQRSGTTSPFSFGPASSSSSKSPFDAPTPPPPPQSQAPSDSDSVNAASPFQSPRRGRPQWNSGLSVDQIRSAEDPVKALPTSELDAAGLDAKWAHLSKKEVDQQEAASTTFVAQQHGFTPYTSRAIAVRGGLGVAAVTAAWRRLHRILAESGIRKELRLTERFEQPSLKRQRLNSERHRRRFKAQVGREITSIMRLKKKGL